MAALALGCGGPGSSRDRDVARGQEPPAALAPPPAAVLPVSSPRFAPSEMDVTDGARVEGKWIAEVDQCEQCHADVVAQWRTSAHAFGSFNNPIYRVSIDRFRAELGNPKSRFCGGCHDIALMVDGAIDGAVEPTDARAHAGITCRTCHSIEHTRPDGNGSYSLTSRDIPAPKLGDKPSIKLHIDRVAQAPLRTAEMCGTCHRVFLGEHSGNARFLAGQDDLTPWMRSVYAGSSATRIDEAIPEQDCKACHMPAEDVKWGDLAATEGRVSSHRFLGGHTWLQAMRGDADGLARARAMLRGAASIDVAVAIAPDGSRTLPADGAPVATGKRMLFDVVVRNQRVGHRFPGGTLDAQDVWIEVEVRDARGALLAEAGTEHEKTGDDTSAHRLKALLAGDDGKPLLEREVNKFRAVVYNHTLAPREAEVVQYAFDVPEALPHEALPLRVSARLRHRTRILPLQAAACADSKTQRGKDFDAERKKRSDRLDPCPPQPIVDVAESEVWIGEGSKGRGPPEARPTWSRLYDHALGLSRVVQERLDEGRPSLERALADLEAAGAGPRERAMVIAALAYLAGKQGRTDEAVGWLDRAAPLLPGHPALAHLRGEALANVWRWSAAVAPLRDAALGAARDDSAWTQLALALGSAGDDRAALDAALRGLALSPRDPDLLRTQALALTALHVPGDAADTARQVYLDHRIADDTPKIKSQCSAKVPGCALERIPVHVHALRPVAAPRR